MIRRVVVGVVALGCAVPAAAGAATYDGTTTLTFNKVLPAKGITVSAVAPAKVSKGRLVLPVTNVSVGGSATLMHAGKVRLRSGKRSVTLSGVSVALARAGRLRAQVGGTTFAIFTVDAKARRLNRVAGAAGLKGGRVRLTAAGAAILRTALKVKGLRPATIGTLTVDAKRGGASTGTTTPGAGGGSTTTGGGGTTTPGGGTTTPGGTPTSPAGCLMATAAGGPAPFARPATAVDVTTAQITWHVRDSFIQYINGGQGTAVCGGATSDPPTVRLGSGAALTYDFHFPFKDGWYDPVTQTARVTFTGAVSFRWAAHGIDLAAANPEIELAGAGSRGLFTTANGGAAPKRGVLETLDPAGGTVDHQPTTHTYTQIPGKIPADAGDSVFAGYYQAGDPFGWVTVQLRTG